MDVNLGTLWEAVADRIGDRQAVVDGRGAITFADLDRQAARLAGSLQAAGVGPGDRVACCLYNGREYVVAIAAALKLRAIPVNLNYRYRGHELRSILEGARAVALVFHDALLDHVADAIAGLAGLRLVVQVPFGDDGRGMTVVAPAISWDAALASEPAARVVGRGDDELFVYTGGTTGLPKAVVWRHRDVLTAFAPQIWPGAAGPPATLEEAARRADSSDSDLLRTVVLAPLMHATGLYSAISTITGGNTLVLVSTSSFDPAAVWATVARDRPARMILTGDAMARPLADELLRADSLGRPYDTSSLRLVLSTGMRWSDDVKRVFLEHGSMTLLELIAATESPPVAMAEIGSVAELPTRFFPTPGTRVLDEDGAEVVPGSGVVGRITFSGTAPSRYHEDATKSESVFSQQDGRQQVAPGDYAQVAADGSLVFLGRGSLVINSGAEKIYPPEVEEVLAQHPGVRDCTVIGVPDERWGEAVAAVVVRATPDVSESELIEFVETRLAGYKKPRRIVFVDAIPRAVNGKLDLASVKAVAAGTTAAR